MKRPIWSDERIDEWVRKQMYYTDRQTAGQLRYPTWADVDAAMRVVRDDYEHHLDTIEFRLKAIIRQTITHDDMATHVNKLYRELADG